MLSLNTRVNDVRESASVAIADRVRRLKASGAPIVGLQTGDPDFDTPAPVVHAAVQAMRDGLTHYTDSRGLALLREAVAGRLAAVHGARYDPQTEILMTHGAVHAYHCALQAIINPGDDVLVPDPSWPTHANMVMVLGGRAVRVPSSPENGWIPTPDAWEQALTPKTVALVICTPANPTGMVYSRDDLIALNDFAARHNLYVITDEVYDNLLYDGRRHACFAALPGAKERTLLVNSLSKTYAMTGWRVGYLCAPEHLINQALKASQHSITNLAPFVQKAAIVALTDEDVADESRRMVEAYARRRERVTEMWRAFGQTPVKVSAPQGAFYFFLDIRELGLTSLEAAERLLDEARVALVPGSAYGPCGEGFLRMTIAASEAEIEEGFEAILRWADAQQ